MSVECIDLEARFGRRYRIDREESYHAQHGPGARRRDPWLSIIPCRFGHLYPFGGDLLAASVDGYPKVAGRLRKLDCCRIHQDGDGGELTVVFHVDALARVARIIRPRRRPRLSPERRAELAEQMRGINQKTPQDPVDRAHTAQGRDPGTSGDSEPAPRQLALFEP
ncbi:MAG: hypothetical protein NTW96_03770 [Planctomycetia bacterium]|nr:hypothetical protein [Planctomycetia bacterium]